MPIDFHSEQNQRAYAARQADTTWKNLISSIIDIRGKAVADIGCGGGIYARALADMQAAQVTCIDWSQVMLTDAQNNLAGYPTIHYRRGEATHTGAANQHFDMALQRALIHHLSAEDLQAYLAEALRILKPGGIVVIQDRTPEDCLLPGSQTHIRGYFFSCYPYLIDLEIQRRHTSAEVRQALQQAGFHTIEERTLWETRNTYPHFSALADDLRARTGRSILHELTGEELFELVDYIKQHIADSTQPIIEQDRWTIWSAVR